MEYFTSADISSIVQWARQPYDKEDPEHQRVARGLKEGPWEKTRHWADLVVERLGGFEVGFERKWMQQSRADGKTITVFKHYTWARIYRQGQAEKEIYFTVGIDADTASLLYKLDYQRSQNSQLPWNGAQICDLTLKGDPSCEAYVHLKDLAGTTWDSLVEATMDFIRSKLDVYDQLVEEAWSESEFRISRLTWNTNGWVFPSGRSGKSDSKDSHESRYGYGHEEWLFDRSKVIDGFHYGFLEPIRKQQRAYSGRQFKVWLYTIDRETKKRYWVGVLNKIQVIDDAEANRARAYYVEKGWHQEMEDQIKASCGTSEGFSDYHGVNLFNIKYRLEDIELNDPYFELPPGHPIYPISRYVFLNFGDAFHLAKSEKEPFRFRPSDGSAAAAPGPVRTILQGRSAKTVEVELMHQAISNAMVPVLRARYGHENVTPEHDAGYGANRVDIVVKDEDGGLIFYEIKTYNSTVMSIRHAIGQLLEYAFWPNAHKAKELVIVTPACKEKENVGVYLGKLRTAFSLPIYYQSFDLGTGILSEKI